jgi:hypothetical protein
VSHCNTGAHAARLLALQCGVDNPSKNLEALALKHKGNKAFESGDLTEAEALFSQVKLSSLLHVHSTYYRCSLQA